MRIKGMARLAGIGRRIGAKIFSNKKRTWVTLVISIPLCIGAVVVMLALSSHLALTASGDGWDLHNYVTGVTVRDTDNQEVIDGVFYYGESYTFDIDFSEYAGIGGQFEYDPLTSHLIYQLPSVIEILTAVDDGVLRVANGSIVGSYTIDKSGHVEVWYGDFDKEGQPSDQNFIERYTDVSFTLELEATFKKGASDGRILFGADASIDIAVKYPDPSIQVVKRSSYDDVSETIVYTTTITALGTPDLTPPQEVKVTSLSDWPWLGNRQSIGSSVSSTSAYGGFRYRVSGGAWNSIVFPDWIAALQGGRTGFCYDFPDGGIALNPGQTIEVETTLDLKQLISGNASATGGNHLQYGFDVGNEIQVTSDYGIGSSTISDHVVKSPLAKTASYDSATEKIDYTVNISVPAGATALTVTDFQDLAWIGNNSTKLSATSLSAFSNFQYRVGAGGGQTPFTPVWNATSRQFDYAFPGGGVVVAPGQTMTIAYTLDLQELIKQNPMYGTRLTYSFSLGNTATVTTNLGTGTDTTRTNVSKTNPVRKTASYNRYTETVTYTVTVSVPTGASALAVKDFQDVAKVNASGLSATSGNAFSNFQYQVGASGSWVSFTPIWNATSRQFDYAFPGEGVVVAPGQTMTITYVLDLQELIKQNPAYGNAFTYSFTLVNSVKVGTNLDDGTGTTTTYIGSGSFLTKSSSYSQSNNTITWTATVGSEGNTKEILNGKDIVDTLGANMNFPSLSDITVTLYRAPSGSTGMFQTTDRIGRTDPTRTSFTADEFGSAFRISGNTATFTVPDEGSVLHGATGTYPEIYRVVISYVTPVPARSDHSVNTEYRNDIKYGSLTAYSTVVITPLPPDPPVVTKTSSGIKQDADGRYYVDYRVSYYVPAGHMNTGNLYFRDILWYEEAAGGGNPAFSGLLTYYDIDNLENLTATLSPTPTGGVGDPVFEYTIANPPDDVNRIYLFYGRGKTIDDLGEATWPYAGAKTLSLSYRVYLDDFELSASSPTMSIEQYLRNNPAATLNNWADARKDGALFGNTVETVDAWPVHKSVTPAYADNSIFNYVVYLNYNQLQALFATGSALFTDTFDSALEYVPKSFYVRENRSAPRYYGPYTGSGQISSAGVTESDAITVGNGSLSVRLDALSELIWNNGLLASSVSNPQTANWYTENYRLEVHYQLRVKNLGSEGTYKNTVEITTKGRDTFTATAEVEHTSRPLSKYMNLTSANGSDAVDVDIIVNPAGHRLVPAGISQDWFKAVDTMSGDLAFYLGTIEIETQTKVDGVWDGKWKSQPTSHVPGELWSINAVSPTEVEFILPDQVPIRIRYVALITVDRNQSATFRNEISVYGYSDVFGSDTYVVTNTAGSARADTRKLMLYKEDSENRDERLGDATFELYMAIPSNQDFGSSAPEKMIDVKGVHFYYVQAATTEPDGVATFSSNWLTPTHKATYLLVETQAPIGYVLPEPPDSYSFFVLHSLTSSQRDVQEEMLEAPVPFVADNVYLTNDKIKGPMLPFVGGIGAKPFLISTTVLSVLLLVFFVGMLIYRNHERKRCMTRLE